MDELTSGERAQIIANVIIAVAGIVGALVAVRFGHQWAQQALANQATESRSNVRAMIAAEIDHNLIALRDYWDGLTQELTDDGEPGAVAGINPELGGEAIMKSFPPVWRHSAWEQLLPNLASSLRPTEITAAMKIYSGLDQVTQLRLELITADTLPAVTESRPGFRPLEVIVESTKHERYGAIVERVWELFTAQISELLTMQNPIVGPPSRAPRHPAAS